MLRTGHSNICILMDQSPITVCLLKNDYVCWCGTRFRFHLPTPAISGQSKCANNRCWWSGTNCVHIGHTNKSCSFAAPIIGWVRGKKRNICVCVFVCVCVKAGGNSLMPLTCQQDIRFSQVDLPCRSPCDHLRDHSARERLCRTQPHNSQRHTNTHTHPQTFAQVYPDIRRKCTGFTSVR